MRRARKKRKRHQHQQHMTKAVSIGKEKSEVELLRKELNSEKCIRKEVEQMSHLNKKRAICYWERWRHELDERKKLQAQVRLHKFCSSHCSGAKYPIMQPTTAECPLINRSLLVNPDGITSLESYVGRGSFGVVKHQLYRGIDVAVKEFLPRTCIESVHHEARILAKLCHPYLPLLIGICTSIRPYCIVMQYHGIDGTSVTLQKEFVHNNSIRTYQSWLLLCAQMVEAIRYLHEDAGIIHNDLKTNNVLLSRSTCKNVFLPEILSEYQVVVIDFGKASNLTSGNKYQLTLSEKLRYYHEFQHMAPEVIEGKMKQSEKSDIYALGKMLAKVCCIVEKLLAKDGIDTIPNLTKTKECICQCTSDKSQLRPHITFIAQVFKDILQIN